MEVAIVFSTIVGLLIVAVAWKRIREIGDSFVLPSLRQVEDEPQPRTESGRNVHSQALERPMEQVQNSPVPAQIERRSQTKLAPPLDINEVFLFDDVVELLAVITVEMPDGSTGVISQERLAKFIGGNREVALERVKQLRGIVPESKPEAYQFERADQRQSFKRVDVKPLRESV